MALMNKDKRSKDELREEIKKIKYKKDISYLVDAFTEQIFGEKKKLMMSDLIFQFFNIFS